MPNDVKYSIRYGFMDGMNLARQLAENLRVRRGSPTQEALARKLGISRATLTRLESAAQNTTIKTLEQIAGALRCSVAELFSGPSPIRRR